MVRCMKYIELNSTLHLSIFDSSPAHAYGVSARRRRFSPRRLALSCPNLYRPGRHSSRRHADNPSAPSTRVFNARGTRSFLRAVRGIGPVRLSASFSEALMQTQEIFGIGIG